MKSLYLAAMIFLSTLATADEIYKCVDDNGKMRFSQRPCGDDAEKMELRDSSSGVKFSDDSENWDEVKYANKEREITRKIEKHQETLNQLKAEKEKTLADLRTIRASTAKNIAGKQYRKQIDKEIQRANADYNKRIKAEETAIGNLKKELATGWK